MTLRDTFLSIVLLVAAVAVARWFHIFPEFAFVFGAYVFFARMMRLEDHLKSLQTGSVFQSDLLSAALVKSGFYAPADHLPMSEAVKSAITELQNIEPMAADVKDRITLGREMSEKNLNVLFRHRRDTGADCKCESCNLKRVELVNCCHCRRLAWNLLSCPDGVSIVWLLAFIQRFVSDGHLPDSGYEFLGPGRREGNDYWTAYRHEYNGRFYVAAFCDECNLTIHPNELKQIVSEPYDSRRVYQFIYELPEVPNEN